jgi:uncharacterized membrane protein YqaE (UPF0057 family)
MKYLVAIFLPPLAVLLCGKPFQSVINFFLTLCFYFPGALHAMLVVSSTNADRRSRDQIEAIREQTNALARMMKGHPSAGQSAPRPAPAPAPAPAPNPHKAPSAPIAPGRPFGDRVRDAFAAILPALASLKAAAIRAYQELPEWAQPITSGLAAATPLSIVFVVIMLSRK